MSLRHTVHWQRDTSDDGADDNTWGYYFRNWPCEIVPVGGQESYRGRQLEATVTHVVTGRRVSGALPSMRLYEPSNERYLNVIRILEVNGRRHDIEVHCSQQVV